MSRDLDRTRQEREFRRNPPKFAPGFGDGDDNRMGSFGSSNGGGGDAGRPAPGFGSGSGGFGATGRPAFGGSVGSGAPGGASGSSPSFGSNNPSGMGTPGGFGGGTPGGFGGAPAFGRPGAASSPFAGINARPGFGGPGGLTPTPTQPKSHEVMDKALDVTGKALSSSAKSAWGISKELSSAAKQNTSVELALFLANTLYVYAGLLVFGLAATIGSIFFDWLAYGPLIATLSVVGVAWSGISWAVVYPKAKKLKAQGYESKRGVNKGISAPTPPPFPTARPSMPTPSPTPTVFPTVDDDDEDEWEDEGDEDEELEPVPVKGKSLDVLLSEDLDIKPGTQTRRFLWEKANSALNQCTPGFDKKWVIDDEDEDFDLFDSILMESCEVIGVPEDSLPEISKITETKFVVSITFSRNSKIKTDRIADEMLKIYQRDEQGALVSPNAFVVFSEFGSQATVSIYKNEEIIPVSLRDVYGTKASENFTLNPKIQAPVTLGVGASGEVYHFDMLNTESMIISGLPRKGKSWLVRAILDQLCTYTSPKDVQLIIGDPKDEISEFAYFDLPHVIRKEFTAEGVAKMLSWLTVQERARRVKIFGEYGVNKISDLHKQHPEVEMPYLYVVLDEMMSLVSYMEDRKSEYREYIKVLVSQLPALGIRGVFVAHRVKDQTIPKDAYELIDARIGVGITPDMVKESLGLGTGEKFLYSASQMGDIAFKVGSINSGEPTYARAIVIDPDSSGMPEYEAYLKHLWSKLEPDFKSSSLNKHELESLKSEVDSSLNNLWLD